MKEHLKNQSFRDGRRVWKVARLISLSKELESFDVPLKHLNIHKLYPQSIGSTKEFVDHVRYVLDADLSCPIILDDEGYVMDGRHRVAKAILNNEESIKAVRFDVTPDCCFVEDD